MIERTTVRLPKDLLIRAKRKALAEDRTLTSLIEEGLRLVVERQRKRKPKPSVSCRVQYGDQRPLPGIDISNSAALQEMEDLEYIERLKNGFK